MYIRVTTYMYMSPNVQQTGNEGEARHPKDALTGAETNLVLPLSPAGQEAPPPPQAAIHLLMSLCTVELQ